MVPVVVSDSGALPEVVVGDLIVQDGDTRELSKAIDDLAANALLRDAISRRKRARALSLYSSAALATRILTFWHEVVER